MGGWGAGEGWRGGGRTVMVMGNLAGSTLAAYSPLELGYRAPLFTGVLGVPEGAHRVDEGRVGLKLALTAWGSHCGLSALGEYVLIEGCDGWHWGESVLRDALCRDLQTGNLPLLRALGPWLPGLIFPPPP